MRLAGEFEEECGREKMKISDYASGGGSSVKTKRIRAKVSLCCAFATARVMFCAGVAMLLFIVCLPSFASTRNDFSPGVDFYAKLGPHTRLYLMSASVHDREVEDRSVNGYLHEMQVGAHLDITLKPILLPKFREGNWERDRYLWVRIGYRYGTSIGDVEDSFHEHRGICELTGRVPLPADFWAVNRFGFDLRDIDGTESTRYRCRFGIERELLIFNVVTVPFVTAEFFYDSRFDTWNRQSYQFGIEIELSQNWRVEPSFVRQEDQHPESSHTDATNALGLTLKYSW